MPPNDIMELLISRENHGEYYLVRRTRRENRDERIMPTQRAGWLYNLAEDEAFCRVTPFKNRSIWKSTSLVKSTLYLSA